MLNEWSAKIMWPNEEFCKQGENHKETWAVTNGFCIGCGKRDISQWNPKTDKNQLFEFLEKLNLSYIIEYSKKEKEYTFCIWNNHSFFEKYLHRKSTGVNLNIVTLEATKNYLMKRRYQNEKRKR